MKEVLLMDVYVARQPIFDRKMNVLGYELLYRRSMKNFYEGTSDSQATAEVINNAFLSMHFNELTSGTKAFINFSHDMLIKGIPLLLPRESIVVEIVERTKVNDELIEACSELRSKRYILALDDFKANTANEQLMKQAHIIKVEFSKVDYPAQREILNKYKGEVKFLAERVETREEFQLAIDMGYDYFQGYFFSKPVIVKGKDIESININIIRILEILNGEEPDYQEITEIIETDIGLTYKLLKLVNSVFFGARNLIHSIKHALVHLGMEEIKKWIYILMLKEVQVIENKELIKVCLIRAKIMELLAIEIDEEKKSDYFLTGMFSSIDILMNQDMQDIMNELPLSSEVKDALLGENNQIRKLLDIVRDYEKLSWDKEKAKAINPKITLDVFSDRHMEALKWVLKLDY